MIRVPVPGTLVPGPSRNVYRDSNVPAWPWLRQRAAEAPHGARQGKDTAPPCFRASEARTGVRMIRPQGSRYRNPDQVARLCARQEPAMRPLCARHRIAARRWGASCCARRPPHPHTGECRRGRGIPLRDREKKSHGAGGVFFDTRAQKNSWELGAQRRQTVHHLSRLLPGGATLGPGLRRDGPGGDYCRGETDSCGAGERGRAAGGARRDRQRS